MSRGLGRRQREVLEACRAWAAAEPHPCWRWVPMDALVTPGGGRAEREALRRAAYRLAEQGLVERGATGDPAWLVHRHTGDDAVVARDDFEAPHVHGFGGDRWQQLVVRLPLTLEERAFERAERERWERARRGSTGPLRPR
jgi:hypothetical protein